MADRAAASPMALLISTAILAAISGYMIGIASSLGFLPIPFMPKAAAPGRRGRTDNYDDEEESSEEDIDDASSTTSTIDHASNAPESPPATSSSFSSCQTPWAAGRPQPPRYMLTGALDSTVRLWDTHTGKCLKKFFGHVEGVWALAGDTLRVVSGAEDRMVKVWDARSGKCEKTFSGHAGPVTCIGLSDSRMVSGSEDCEVRVYSFKNEGGDLDLGGGTPR